MRPLALVLALAVAAGFAFRACSVPWLAEASDDKQEWAALQAIELDTREHSLSEPVLRRVQDREVLGVRGSSGNNIWILLKPEAPPWYKQLPEGQYELPLSLVERLRREDRLSPVVETVLRSHVHEQ